MRKTFSLSLWRAVSACLLALTTMNTSGYAANADLHQGPALLYLPLLTHNYPPQTIFGAEMSSITPSGGLTQMAAAQTQWVRRAAVEWSLVQPVANQAPNWTALASLEQELLTAVQNKMSVILVVRGVPGW